MDFGHGKFGFSGRATSWDDINRRWVWLGMVAAVGAPRGKIFRGSRGGQLGLECSDRLMINVGMCGAPRSIG